MAPKLMVRSALMLIVVGMFAATVSAQQVELYPNAADSGLGIQRTAI